VRRLIDTLGIRAVIFVDADPSGIQLALSHAHGSISTALETPWLACNDLWWAGLQPSDIDRHCPSNVIRLQETDYEAARRLLEHPSHAYVNDRVRAELSILLERGVKAELDSLIAGASRLEAYLLHKLFDRDLIKL